MSREEPEAEQGPEPTAPDLDAVLRAEAARLSAFTKQLEALARRSAGLDDPAARAALQDANLEAFEAMTTEVGAGAFQAMRACVAELRAALDGEAARGGDPTEGLTETVDKAIGAVDALRAERMAEVLAESARRLEAALAARRPDDPDPWEPFEG